MLLCLFHHPKRKICRIWGWIVFVLIALTFSAFHAVFFLLVRRAHTSLRKWRLFVHDHSLSALHSPNSTHLFSAWNFNFLHSRKRVAGFFSRDRRKKSLVLLWRMLGGWSGQRSGACLVWKSRKINWYWCVRLFLPCSGVGCFWDGAEVGQEGRN